MKKYSVVLFFIFLIFDLMGQPAFTAGVPHSTAAPAWSPSASGSRLAVDYSAKKVYIWNGSAWLEYEQGIDQITGSVAPAYTPAAGQSLWAVNAVPELYYYTGSAWVCMSCQSGIVTDATLTGDGTDGGPLGIAQQGATTGQVLKWDGSAWVPGDVDGGGGAIAATQIAYGSGTNTITGNANFIYSGGNVAIGTASTPARINVVGAGATSGTYTAVFHNSTGTNNALVVRDDGKVGIGTTSFSGGIKLAVNGQIGGGTYSSSYLDFTGSTPEIRGNSGLGYYSVSGDHIFYGASSLEKVRISSGGNVGIGGITGTRTLDINGELRIRDLTTTTATQILVADNDGVVSSATLGSGLSLSGGTLSSTGSTNLTFSGSSSPVTLNSSTGTDVNYVAGTGISLSATSTDLTISNSLKMREESFIATGGQTAFTIAYSAPAVSGTSVPLRVYRNGVRLFWVASAPSSTQFTYSGTTVTTAPNTAGDIITIEYLN